MPGGVAGGTGAVGAGRAAVASHGYGSPSLDTWLRTSLRYLSLQDYSRQFPTVRRHDARAAEAHHTTTR